MPRAALRGRRELEPLSGAGVEHVRGAGARTQEHGFADVGDRPAVGADHERLGGRRGAVEGRVAVHVRVRAELLDQLDDDRDAALAGPDELAVLGAEADGYLV